MVPIEDLVVGDLVVLRGGERVPADVRLTHIRGLRTDESTLTGEPGDVEKHTSPLAADVALADQSNMAFGGTLVTAGSARGIVVATGERSVIGRLVRRVVEAGAQATPLEKRLRFLGGMLGAGLVAISGFLFAAGVLSGISPRMMFQQTLTLAVSAIPEDLTLILTVALAIGARRILAKRGIVRHLTAAETLGDATVVCTDKTGTLTKGQITLTRIEGVADAWRSGVGEEHAPRENLAAVRAHPLLLRIFTAALAGTDTVEIVRDAPSQRGSAIERAIARAAREAGVEFAALRRAYPLFHTIAFDSARRYSATLHSDPARAEPVAFVAGAPEAIIPTCVAASDGDKSVRLTREGRDRLLAHAAEHAREGKRVLSVAQRSLARTARTITPKDVSDLTFLALLVFDDPPRPDARAAVEDLQRAGVRVVLLTGDHRGTAEAVARDVGIARAGERAVEGAEIMGLSDEALGEALRDISVVARVDPFQKERIVHRLQARGDIVGMVGDGINDAVALRRADLGVAVGSATDVAKDAADLVMTGETITTLAAAVHEGRRVRETVRTVLSFLFATNATEVLMVVGALFLGVPLPFLPAMLLWINVVTDGTADIALALEPASTRPGDPDPGRRRGIFRSGDPLMLLYAAVVVLIPAMLAYLVTLWGAQDVAAARTVAFIALAASQILAAFAYRSLTRPLVTMNPFGNPWLIASTVFSFSLLVLAVTTAPLRDLLGTVPLSGDQWLLALGTAALGAAAVESRKWFFPSRWFRANLPLSAPRRVGEGRFGEVRV